MRRIFVRAVLESSFVLLLLGVAFGDQAGIGVGDHPRSLTVGDFNRDGWQDLAVANELSNDITILIAKGDGTFEPKPDAIKYDSYRPVIPEAITAGDLTGDGKEDLALAACGLTEVVTTTTSGTTETTKITYANVFTTTFLNRANIPVIMETDREAIEAALQVLRLEDTAHARIVRIKNTLEVSQIQLSTPLLEEFASHPHLEPLGEPKPLAFTEDGALL